MLNKETPSPESQPSTDGRPLFKGAAAFTCLVLLIDLPIAVVDLEEMLS